MNPLRAQRGEAWRLVFRSVNIALIAVIAVSVYYFFFSVRYRINDVEVRGVSSVSTQDVLTVARSAVEAHRFLFFKTKNIFLFDGSEIANTLNEEYVFDAIQTTKSMPHTIVVTIKERQIAFRMKSTEREYLIDREGVVVRKNRNYSIRPSLLSFMESSGTPEADAYEGSLVTNTEGDLLPLIFIRQAGEIALGQKILATETVDFINEIITFPRQRYFTLGLVVIPDAASPHIEIRTEGGWKILMMVPRPLTEQFKALETVIEGEIGEARLPRVDYIDLRLGDNIYYKFK